MRNFILTLAMSVMACTFGLCAFAQPEGCPVIPQVSSYSPQGGQSLPLPAGSTYKLDVQKGTEGLHVFEEYLAESGLGLVPAPRKGAKALVRFKVGPKALKAKDGAYTIEVGRKGVVVTAGGFKGAFYAVQTLKQLAAASPDRSIPYCKIQDEPRFAYRGLLFDLVRHFHGKEFIFRQLDLMSSLKMSVLHLHLTDNEGWRLELDCAPEMTREAAFGDSLFFHTILSRSPLRFATEPEGYVSGTVYDRNSVYGGYFSKQDIREIIDYAAARHIEIIPEIEFPGHNKALLHVHPEFFCRGEHGVDNVICAGDDAVFDFFFKVLEEVMDLFPSQYLHIGGDEASKANWLKCSHCQERMRAEGLKDVYELQSYCIRRMDSFISAHGKKMIGWDEILEGGLSENATVMSWRGTEGGLESIKKGHDVIMTPNTYYYLDYGQDSPFKEPVAFNTYLPLERVYSYEPEAEIESGASHLLGVQGNLWSECVITDEHFEYMLYPRAFAIAETGWSPKGSKDYASFRERAVALCKQLKGQYNCFDLDNEAGDRPEASVKRPCITQNAKAVLYSAGKSSIPAEGKDVSGLVDGYLGGWAMKGSDDWIDAGRYATTVDIDLGEIKDIHYVGAEFVDYNLRGMGAPQDTEFYFSADGVQYELAPVPQLKLNSDRKYYSIVTAGGTVEAKARYVRLRFNTGKAKNRVYLGEIIIN